MTGEQWKQLLAVIAGEPVEPLPVGFIIDSPWLPAWAGISILDYFSSEQAWFEANLKAVHQFPDVIFLPGFWVEFGMCTEPSAFGAKCSWQENELPYAHKIITDVSQVTSVIKPDPKTDGLAPFVIKRLQRYQRRIEQAGHAIRFAVSRGPLNIASFLMGTTEFLMATQTNPDEIRSLLAIVTDYIVDWLKLQAVTFRSIDGLLILDDIVGFLGENDFVRFARPYLSRIFQSMEVTVRFFHNDASGIVCAPHLAEIGVNLFNFSHQHLLTEMRRLAGDSVTLLGNIPGRDILAAGSADEVRDAVKAALDSIVEKTRLILSCGGGMPPGVSTKNIEAFVSAVGGRP
jgi:uroporphyrinogen decarboxylase